MSLHYTCHYITHVFTGSKHSSGYDPQHRNPLYCHAEQEYVWELQKLASHYITHLTTLHMSLHYTCHYITHVTTLHMYLPLTTLHISLHYTCHYITHVTTLHMYLQEASTAVAMTPSIVTCYTSTQNRNVCGRYRSLPLTTLHMYLPLTTLHMYLPLTTLHMYLPLTTLHMYLPLTTLHMYLQEASTAVTMTPSIVTCYTSTQNRNVCGRYRSLPLTTLHMYLPLTTLHMYLPLTTLHMYLPLTTLHMYLPLTTLHMYLQEASTAVAMILSIVTRYTATQNRNACGSYRSLSLTTLHMSLHYTCIYLSLHYTCIYLSLHYTCIYLSLHYTCIYRKQAQQWLWPPAS